MSKNTVVISSDCPANTLRGRLKHSWLENQVLNKDERKVLRHWRKRGWPELGRDFPGEIGRVMKLAGEAEQGFSPALLVDELEPFANVDEDMKEQIRRAVHAAYLEATDMPRLARELAGCGESLGEALEQLLEAWRLPPDDENEKRLLAKWKNFADKAEKLHNILEKLPKGIVLP